MDKSTIVVKRDRRTEKKNKLIWNQTKKKHGWFWNRKYYTKEEAIKFLEQNNKKYKIIDIYFKNQLENAKAIEKSCLICRKFGNKINLTNEQIGLLIF